MNKDEILGLSNYEDAVDMSKSKMSADEMLLKENAKDLSSNRTLREMYAEKIMFLVKWLTIVTTMLVFLAGCGIIKIEEWTFRLFITGAFVEVFAIARIVAKHLFPISENK